MELVNQIKEAIKTNRVIFGYKKVIKALKTSELSMIILADNTPERIKKDIMYNSNISRTDVKIFDRTNVELGIVCGKPFPITVLGIKR